MPHAQRLVLPFFFPFLLAIHSFFFFLDGSVPKLLALLASEKLKITKPFERIVAFLWVRFSLRVLLVLNKTHVLFLFLSNVYAELAPSNPISWPFRWRTWAPGYQVSGVDADSCVHCPN